MRGEFPGKGTLVAESGSDSRKLALICLPVLLMAVPSPDVMAVCLGSRTRPNRPGFRPLTDCETNHKEELS